MNIEDLAKEKVGLEMRLQAIGQMNMFGMDLEHRIEVEIDLIKTRKRLNELNNKIFKYEQP